MQFESLNMTINLTSTLDEILDWDAPRAWIRASDVAKALGMQPSVLAHKRIGLALTKSNRDGVVRKISGGISYWWIPKKFVDSFYAK